MAILASSKMRWVPKLFLLPRAHNQQKMWLHQRFLHWWEISKMEMMLFTLSLCTQNKLHFPYSKTKLENMLYTYANSFQDSIWNSATIQYYGGCFLWRNFRDLTGKKRSGSCTLGGDDVGSSASRIPSYKYCTRVALYTLTRKCPVGKSW